MWLYEKLTTITFMWFCRINKVVDIVVLISLTSVKFLQFIQCFCRRNPKLKLIIKSKKITIHSFLNGLNYRSWLNQWTVYSFKYGWDNIQIYLIYISIDTVFRPRRTHQYGSIHQIFNFAIDGLEPWILRYIIYIYVRRALLYRLNDLDKKAKKEKKYTEQNQLRQSYKKIP